MEKINTNRGSICIDFRNGNNQSPTVNQSFAVRLDKKAEDFENRLVADINAMKVRDRLSKLSNKKYLEMFDVLQPDN